MPTDTISIPPSLREKYISQVTVRRTELERFLAVCEQQNMSSNERDAARVHAHSLKGTGRTYGYPAVSAAGHALEEAIDANTDQASLAAFTRALIAACDGAIEDGKDAPATISEQGVELASITAAVRDSKELRPTILIVDDDPAIRGMLQQLLSRDGEIVTATNSSEALEMMERHRPDLVVLDDRMPGMGGIEMLERLREEGKPLPSQIVMLTANNRTPDIIAGMTAGAVDYITKPFEPDRLVNRIRLLLQHLKTTILVADDDAAVRGMLQHKFRMMGFRLIYAEDGERAIKVMREERPQLAIIDRMMPGLDGLAVLQKIRTEENLRSTPVILLTAKRQNKDVVEGFQLGATDYIVKPFMPDEVVARAIRLLGLNAAVQS